MSALLSLRARPEQRIERAVRPQLSFAPTPVATATARMPVTRRRPVAPAATRDAGSPHRPRRADGDRSPRSGDRQQARRARPHIARRPEPQVSVLVASPIAWCRKHWLEAIGRHCDVHEIADVGLLEQAVAKVRPDVVLVDQELWGAGASDGVNAIQRLSTVSRVLVLAKNPDESEALAVFKAGAHGYCDRNIDSTLLAKAVRVVQKGEIWIGRDLISRLVDELAFAARRATPAQSEFAARLEGISARQRQVLDLLSTGATNKEIACQLAVTTRTVKAHLGAVFAKVGIWGRVRLTAALLEHSRIAVADDAPRGRTQNPGLGLRDVAAKEVASKRARSAAV
jgi:DNA-binding NarL/FixJ family response regulator